MSRLFGFCFFGLFCFFTKAENSNVITLEGFEAMNKSYEGANAYQEIPTTIVCTCKLGKQYSGYCKDGISCWPKTFSISFGGCFPMKPDVIAALTVIDSSSTTGISVSVKALNVTNCGFDMKINPFKGAILQSATASWIACPVY
eukprot:m.68653 g.68653  ORF g.68653 m.68653 type:complete len:144 (+) comp35538_c0_seq1:166-597(+)